MNLFSSSNPSPYAGGYGNPVGNTGLTVEAIVNMCQPRPKEILTPGRKFLYEGDLVQYVPEDRKKKLRHCFLFNDAILISKKEGPRRYWPRILVSFTTGLRVENVEDSQNEIPGVEFRIYAPKKTLILFGSTREERDMWIKMLRDQIGETENVKTNSAFIDAGYSTTTKPNSNSNPYVPANTNPYVPANTNPYVPANTNPYVPANTNPYQLTPNQKTSNSSGSLDFESFNPFSQS